METIAPGLEGVAVTRSSISDLDGEKGILSYRGYPIEDLAKNSTFEQTSYLLFHGELPNKDELETFSQRIRSQYATKPAIWGIMRMLPTEGRPMDMLQTAIASLGMHYPNTETSELAWQDNQTYVDNMSTKILGRMGTLVAMWQSIRQRKDFVGPDETMSYAENFLYMYHGETPNPDHVRIMDTCLTLHAEHTINASTFSAMVAGSTLATPSQVISSAIGTLAGPLHGGANQKVVPMLKEIGSPENARSWMIERMKQKKVVWGMGHREYSVKDPRATILEGMMKKIGIKDAQVFETALALEEVCEEFLAPKGVFPNVELYSGILYTELGFDSDQFTPLFAISRTAGWLAHWQEQIRQNRIFRPTQIYIGEKLRFI